ncbi:uncharacterized protein BJ212DRAFT_1480008 [Suillus subaureus]|uniref:BTB domain-containing protein n=1 Tax=Suillus subaureus TaxID=48587 RepID=A0A9P7EDG6_9AGAM|nr:uncharacterized protein BJ212DRAFT_1480008 [Suillus subaureus]KAG1818191.1 hypothetical protein BJ212DRAFT_1480008 [Suillus subaureus]
MSDHQALVEALLMKSILGQGLVDTKFHLFSGCSAHSRKVSQVQALSANDVVLTARSDFFAERKLFFTCEGGELAYDLSLTVLSRTGPPDATFVDFDDDSAFEDGMGFDDYGYASDSDLEDEDVEKASQTPVRSETATPEGNTSELDENDDDLLVVADVTPITSPLIQHKVPDVNCRNILVRDTAFRTWKALLLYLYTNKIVFSPLKSQGQPRADVEGPNPSTLWPCSPKSMYRLGCKVRLDSVRDQAFRAIRDSLNAENILQELSSSFTSKYPAILQMQVQVLIQHIASVPVIQNIPALVRRIVDSQLPHGADIIIDLYQKFLLQCHPRALALANSPTEKEPSPQPGAFGQSGVGAPVSIFGQSGAAAPVSVFGQSGAGVPVNIFGQSGAGVPVNIFGQSASRGAKPQEEERQGAGSSLFGQSSSRGGKSKKK